MRETAIYFADQAAPARPIYVATVGIPVFSPRFLIGLRKI
jgi:hypothetical protein